MAITGEDDAFVAPRHFWTRSNVPTHDFGVGGCVRDWAVVPADEVAFMYSRGEGITKLVSLDELGKFDRIVWPLRTTLRRRLMFGKYPEESGLAWYEYRYFARERYGTLSIAFAAVATHNHFVLDRDGKVFAQSAPVIKLPAGASENEHLGLLGLLNSSTACFWMRQVFHCKGAQGINEGGKEEKWEQFYDFDGTKIKQFPLPSERPAVLAAQLEGEAQDLLAHQPRSFARTIVPSRETVAKARWQAAACADQLVAVQEELDWYCYRLYGLIGEDLCHPDGKPPLVKLGERAFEIVLARKMKTGELATEWFARHGSTPATDIPTHWPQDYRRLVQRRIDAIESNPNIALIEQPEYKRRWNSEPWEAQEERTLRGWLLDRLEDARYWPEPRLMSCARLADRVREDAELMQVAELYRGRSDFDLARLVTELVEAEGVPFLPVLRYTTSGMQKRRAWEECWSLQRREDAGEAVREIAVPPKYRSGDFKKGAYWRLRGKLDVPKERFILYPGAERGADPTPMLGWAGWDALQQAQALSAHFIEMKETEGWPAERLVALLAGLLELLPWLRQWHNDLDPSTRLRMGDYFAQFLDEEARGLGVTLDDLRSWVPAFGAAVRGRRARR
jgi:hypothetical protein